MVLSLCRVSVSLKRENQRSLRWKSLDRCVRINVENRLGDKRKNRKGTWRWRLVIFLRRHEWIYASYPGNAWGNVSTIVYSSQTTFFPRGRIFRSSMHSRIHMDKQLSSFPPRNGPIVYRVYFLRFFATQPIPVTPPWETVRFLKLRFLAARALRKNEPTLFCTWVMQTATKKMWKKRGNFSLRLFRIVAQSTKSCTKNEKKKKRMKRYNGD